MPDWNATIRQQLEPLKLAAARESEIAEELTQHAEERYRELIADGATEDHAQNVVFDELTQHQLLTNELRAIERTNSSEPHGMGNGGGGNLVAGLARDVRYALRTLSKSLKFSLFAVGMLGFGIGATTAIYSIVEGVLLRPLPFVDPERLVVLGDHVEGTNWGQGVNIAPVTAPEIRTYARDTHAFESLGGLNGASFELSAGGEPAAINGTRLTAGIFRTLGVAPLLGRTFTAEEDEGHQPVVVLSYATWKSRFQGNPSVVGTKIVLDRKPYLVIGVMPRSFEFPLNPGQLSRSELWVPMSFSERELTKGAGSWNMVAVGRLKPGITLAQAQDDSERVSQEIMRNFLANIASIHINAVVQPLREVTVMDARPLVRTLFLAVVVVLLIVCANLAGLLLVRVIRRQREIALRLALGASAAVLLRQVLLESLVLSGSGGVLGIGLAALALQVGKKFLPESLPRINEIGLNWEVVVFALVLAVITGLLCGLTPAFAALRTNVNSSLKDGGLRGPAGSRHTRLRSALAVGEIAVALILVIASGLLIRSFEKMSAVELGYRPEHLTTAAYELPRDQYATQPVVDAFNHELVTRLRRLPGAVSATFADTIPGSDIGLQTFVVESYVAPRGAGLNVAVPFQVGSDYFRTMGIAQLRGRSFNDGDQADTQLAVIVNQKFAQHFWPNQDPLGKRMRIGTPEMKTPWMSVIGEIADVKLGAPDADTIEQFYQPVDQARAEAGSMASPGDLRGNGGYIVLRSTLPAEEMENALRATVRTIDPLLPLAQVQTMEQAVAGGEASRKFNTALITSFAIAAILLAVLGIYSIIAFSVAARQQEMAIRMALGSQRGRIVQLVVISGAKLAAVGCVIGVAGAAAVSGLLRSMLFDVSPFDPLVLVLAAVAVVLLAVGASALPALRAASVDPMRALRAE